MSWKLHNSLRFKSLPGYVYVHGRGKDFSDSWEKPAIDAVASKMLQFDVDFATATTLAQEDIPMLVIWEDAVDKKLSMFITGDSGMGASTRAFKDDADLLSKLQETEDRLASSRAGKLYSTNRFRINRMVQARMDFADELRSDLGEAIVRPSTEDVRAVMEIIRRDSRNLPELNRNLEPFGIRIDLHDPELTQVGAPARTGLDGIVFNRIPRSPSDFRWFEKVLRHELIHLGQMDRADKTGSALRMFYGDQERLVDPSGKLNREEYENNSQEMMAAAHDVVDRFKQSGMSREQILRILKSTPPDRRHPSSRFLRYAAAYLDGEQVP